MTEASYQAGRKLMQRANYMRGWITSQKNNVAKWTKIEGSYRERLQEDKADGAKKIIEKAIKQLEEARRNFANLSFPPNNLK